MELLGIYFERPYWFLVVIPLGILMYVLYTNIKMKSNWQELCDHHLLKYLMVKRVSNSLQGPLIGLLILWLFASVALVGPVLSKQKVRIYNDKQSKIILLDMSTSMYSNDVKPSRFERAKFKVLDLLKLIKTGQTALVAFAGDAFTVTPLTDDTNTIKLHMTNLEPNIMPVQGSRSDLALQKGLQLLEQGAVASGEIILITDEIDKRSFEEASNILAAGHRISVIAVGTQEGAPVPLRGGGFLKDRSGAIVIPKVDMKSLAALARKGGGYFANMTTDDSDLNIIMQNSHNMQNAEESDQYAEIKRDIGPWLVLLMLPIFALGFRKGLLNIVILCCVMNYGELYAFELDSLLWNKNQQAKEKFDQKKYDDSAKTFTDSEWKAAAHYKNKNWQEALKEYQKIDTADGYYNRGNTLAKLNRFEEAIQAYDQALALQKEHEDARHNKKLIMDLLKNSKNKNSNQKADKQDNAGQQSSGDSQEGDADSKQQNQQPQNADKNSSEKESSEGEQNNKSDLTDSQSKEKSKSLSTKEAEEKMQKIQEKLQSQKPDKDTKGADKKNNDQRLAKQDELPEGKIEEKQSVEQWLRKVPDDPGGLLRKKFQQEYLRRKDTVNEVQNW